MLTQNSIDTYLKLLQKHNSGLPEVSVVLGSGFGLALDTLAKDQWQTLGEISFGEVPGLFKSSVQDHKGSYRLLKHLPSGKTVQFQMGRLHGYEGHEASHVVLPVMIPRAAGVRHFILTNAAGGLDRAMQPGDVVLIEDHVNMTGQNPLTGPNPSHPDGRPLGPRFPDMGNCYNPEWRARLKRHLEEAKLRVHKGTYLGLSGPSFETHAEVRLYSSWGMKAVGMSTVWESIALHHSGAQLAAISLISNLGAGLSDAALDHESILQTSRTSAGRVLQALSQFLGQDLLR